MMDATTKRKLNLLDNMINGCKGCELYHNGRVKPYWTEQSSYIIIGDVPNENEVSNNEPFTGKDKSIFWEIMKQYGFKKEQFLIINCVNCKPINQDDKFMEYGLKCCNKWYIKYLNVLLPLKGIIFGQNTQKIILNENNNMIYCNATITSYRIENFNSPLIPFVRSVPPIYATYTEGGKRLLDTSISKFKLI